MTKNQLYDVVAISLLPPHPVKLVATNKTYAAAETAMRVAMHGVDACFYTPIPAGAYKDGDAWRGHSDD